MSPLDAAVRTALDWPVDHVAVALVAADGELVGAAGDLERAFPLASVTKLMTAYATLVAVERGALGWIDPAGPEGSTVGHLAAHASGLAFDGPSVQARPGDRRIYSNTGFEVLGEVVASAVGTGFADHLERAVLAPLGMSATRLDGSPAAGGVSTAGDLARFAGELQNPTLVGGPALAVATTVAFPGLDGVLPGYGRQQPNDWGLGFEIRGQKSPHWTGTASSPRTFGHFGAAGTFLWVDPDEALACVALTDRDFGPWAVRSWTAFTDGVLAAW